MNRQDIENEIQEKQLNAPRLTPDLIDSVIVDKMFHVFPNTGMTVCCLVLKNGYNVIGESCPASIENFNKELGEKISFESAKNKIWQLEGYLLRQRLYDSK